VVFDRQHPMRTARRTPASLYRSPRRSALRDRKEEQL
jgi:hypothetical protein